MAPGSGYPSQIGRFALSWRTGSTEPAISTMLKGKFNLPHKKRVVLDRLGSLIIGFEDDLASDLEFESGEELETFRSNGFGSKDREEEEEDAADDDERKEFGIDDDEKLLRDAEVRFCRREVAEIPKSISSSASLFSRKDAADKAAELEFEVRLKQFLCI